MISTSDDWQRSFDEQFLSNLKRQREREAAEARATSIWKHPSQLGGAWRVTKPAFFSPLWKPLCRE